MRVLSPGWCLTPRYTSAADSPASGTCAPDSGTLSASYWDLRVFCASHTLCAASTQESLPVLPSYPPCISSWAPLHMPHYIFPQTQARNMKKEASIQHFVLKTEYVVASVMTRKASPCACSPVPFLSHVAVSQRWRPNQQQNLQPFSLMGKARSRVLSPGGLGPSGPSTHSMTETPHLLEPTPLPRCCLLWDKN